MWHKTTTQLMSCDSAEITSPPVYSTLCQDGTEGGSLSPM